MLKLKNISKSYGEKNILNNLEFNVKKGDFVAIVGKSGCGKSTLLNILGLIDYHDQGIYEFNDIIINKKNKFNFPDFRNKYIGFVFQSYYLIPHLTIMQNLMLPFIYSKKKENNFKKRIKELLINFELFELKNQIVNNLSGGEKQRVALLRSLIMDPLLLLCDEPTGNLDNQNSEIVINALFEQNNLGATIVIVTHDFNIAKRANKIYELKEGMLHELVL